MIVIGAGQSGLLAAIRLKQAGIPFTVVEKNPGVGGTWWENSYPGARVDVGNHFYCSFEPSDHWTEFFARQPELQATILRRRRPARAARAHSLQHRRQRRRMGRCGIDLVGHRAQPRTVRMRPCVRVRSSAPSANSTSRSSPTFPADSFAGPAFHTARWDHGVDLAGRDVVMVGAGATGFQVAPRSPAPCAG